MTDEEKITEIITKVKLPTVGGGCYSIEERRARIIANALVTQGIGLKTKEERDIEDLNSKEQPDKEFTKEFTEEEIDKFVGKRVVFKRFGDKKWRGNGILRKSETEIVDTEGKPTDIKFYRCGGYCFYNIELAEIKEYEGE